MSTWSNYSRCLCSLARTKLQAKTSCIGDIYISPCWEKLNTSLPCLAEVLADHTCLCCNLFCYFVPSISFCFLPSLCSPWCTESWCQALMQPHHLPGPARHGYMLLLLFLLLRGAAKIAHGTCNAKIPGAFWPASGMVLFMKLFPGSPVDLGNGNLALSKWTAPKYSCCAAGLVSSYAQDRQAGSCLGCQWHVLAESHHCMLLLFRLCLILIAKLA